MSSDLHRSSGPRAPPQSGQRPLMPSPRTSSSPRGPDLSRTASVPSSWLRVLCAPVSNSRSGLLLTLQASSPASPSPVPATRLRKQTPGAAGQPTSVGPGHPLPSTCGSTTHTARQPGTVRAILSSASGAPLLHHCISQQSWRPHGLRGGLSVSPPAPPSLLLHICPCLGHVLNSTQTFHPWPLSLTRLAS